MVNIFAVRGGNKNISKSYSRNNGKTILSFMKTVMNFQLNQHNKQALLETNRLGNGFVI